MHARTIYALLGLCLAGFAFSLYRAGIGSGTDTGNLWLLTSLIVGIGLIATALAVIAQLAQTRSVRRASGDQAAQPSTPPPRSSPPAPAAPRGRPVPPPDARPPHLTAFARSLRAMHSPHAGRQTAPGSGLLHAELHRSPQS
jgi:hypothetical protein